MLPRWLSGEKSACNVADTGLIPVSGRCPGEGNALEWQTTPVFLPGESHGQRCLLATVHGVAEESDKT